MTHDDTLSTRIAHALNVQADLLRPPVPPLDDVLRRSRSRNQRRTAIVASVAVVVVAAVATSLIAGAPHQHKTPTAPSDPAASVHALPPAPLSARANPSVAWTPAGLFIWAGDAGSPPGTDNSTMGGPNPPTFADGAMYQPATKSWHKIAPGPLSATSFAPAVWTGTDVLVAGGTTKNPSLLRSHAALYSPSTDRWTEVPDAPNCPQFLLNTGRSVIAIGACTPTGPDAAQWLPETRTWKTLPRSGAGSIVTASTLHGHVVVIGNAEGRQRLRLLDGSTWKTLPSPPHPVGEDDELNDVVATPRGLFKFASAVVNDTDTGYLWRLTGSTWTEVAHGTTFVPDVLTRSVVTPDGFVFGSIAGGLCRYNGAIACISSTGTQGLDRYDTTYATDSNGTIYLWGGDFIPPSKANQQDAVTSNTGVTVSFH